MLVFLRLAVLCLILASTVPAAAAGFVNVGLVAFTWEGIFTSGRLSTLGGGDLADSSPAALLVNPAPLFTGNGVGLSYDHADYITDVEFHTYAGAAEWNDWRLNIAVSDFVIDSALVRTAYNPTGTGETYSIRDRMVVMGLGYNLGQALFGDSAYRWSVGAAWRRFSASQVETTAGGNSLDLGTTFCSRAEHAGGWTGLTGVVAWQNVTGESITTEENESRLPRRVRAGLTLETAFTEPGRSYDTFKMLMAYTRVFQIGETYQPDRDHVGVEALFYSVLALRYGFNTQVVGGIRSWGFGVVLDQRLLGPFEVEIDWGQMMYDNELFDGDKSIWGVRARYNF